MEQKNKLPFLDVDRILSLFGQEGRLSNSLRGFEVRESQRAMLCDVVEAYNRRLICLIEAGTGTGKSLAYLVPALIWALQNHQCSVISTNTITLQEQLLGKDIPLLKKVLNVDFKAVLVKGMNNYLCLRKLDMLAEELSFFSKEEKEQLETIVLWSQKTKDGSRSTLPMLPSRAVWEKVYAEGDACSGNKCPHYEGCFFFKARKRASKAHLLIVNHHLLFADIAMRMESNDYTKAAILPAYDHLILDEAHNIEDIATEHFAFRVSRFELTNLLSKLSCERQGNHIGKLFSLKEKIYRLCSLDADEAVRVLLNRIEIEFSGERRVLSSKVDSVFSMLVEYFKSYTLLRDPQEDFAIQSYKLRFLEKHFAETRWLESLSPALEDLISLLQRYAQSLLSLEGQIKQFENEKIADFTRDLLMDISALAAKLDRMAQVLKEFAFGKDHISIVRWAELSVRKGMEHVTLVGAKLNISQLLCEQVFKKFSTIVLCSGTLATNQKFDFIRRSLGIEKEFLGGKEVIESIYDSPFDYLKQSMIVVPTGMPNPNEESFLSQAAEKIWSVVRASRGNAFILFTSFSMLDACYRLLLERFRKVSFPVLKQGNEHRRILLQRFKEMENSVLFATNSFWEGVDVVGDALRCVIVVKLPFQVPSEPIVQARTEAIFAKGGNAFMDYVVPHAIVKFKQGIGRLIRHSKDRGCIVCLDSRLMTKAYGKHFLHSLPKSKQVFEDDEKLIFAMLDFYKKTYYLTKPREQWSVTESNR